MTVDSAIPASLRAEPGIGAARRVLWLRAIAIPGPAVLLLAGAAVTGAELPLLQLVILVLALAAVNLWTWRRIRASQRFTDQQFFGQLVFDVLALTGILYYSGGATNPFVFFFLLPLTITATALPRRFTWAMAGLTVGSYTLLLVMRRPLPLFVPTDSPRFLDLHAGGMWIGFVMIAVLVAHYVAGIGEMLRDRDRRLAMVRERALRDERLLALGTLAAGAAHELSTPLGTLGLLAEEIAADYPQARFPELHRQLALLRSQVSRCKEALTVMVSSAGAERADDAAAEALPAYLDRLAGQLRTLRPQAGVRVEVRPSDSPPPALAAGRMLDQALTNLLNNAVDAAPREVALRGAWTGDAVTIDILDRGPGPGALTPGRAGAAARAAPSGGLGVGLLIAESVIQQCGGRLEFAAREGGGTRARVVLPRGGGVAT